MGKVMLCSMQIHLLRVQLHRSFSKKEAERDFKGSLFLSKHREGQDGRESVRVK